MESNKKGLARIAYNCHRATLLIEKKLIDKLSLREKLELKIHLAGCSVCRTFEKQSALINRMVQQLIHGSHCSNIKLDDYFKHQMQERIEEELTKN